MNTRTLVLGRGRIAIAVLWACRFGAQGEPPPPPPSDTGVTVPAVPTSNVFALGYDHLDPAIRTRDVERVNAALHRHGSPENWPTREVARPTDVRGFPFKVQRTETRHEPVPLYVIVDPAAIDRAWDVSRARGDATLPYPPLDGADAHAVVAFFSPSTLPADVIIPPWPSWADQAWDPDRNPPFKGMGERSWSSIATTTVAWNNVLRSSLERRGIKLRALTYIDRVSDGVWRVMPNREVEQSAVPPRGTLVFPLWESPGLLRADDAGRRNSPMSASVSADAPELSLPEVPGLVLAAPLRTAGDSPRREWVVLPETAARLPVPVVSVYVASGSHPLAADYTMVPGLPSDTGGLVAVCVFSTIPDEQLAALARALTD